ncbi:MAG: hypothetical protein IPK22_07230 [Verrucomicrobiaceae bacterium]|nr:hypothetical protein [Verrucomicrobiaceae bacterium]
MPTVKVSYTIEWATSPKASYTGRYYVSNLDLFLALADLGVTSNVPFTDSAKSVFYRIEADETDPIHDKVSALFRAHGIDLDTLTKFHGYRSRHYEKTEYDQFEFLSLRPEKLAWIAEFAENRGGVHVLKANDRLKNKLAFGSVEQSRVFYASDEGREHLSGLNLTGIDWEPVVFDHPEKAAKGLFRLCSSVTMPKCLTPIVDSGYTDVTTLPEAEVQDRQWYNGGYLPAEMSFRRNEVEALGQFDVAITQELVGGFPRWYHPEVIVSQRFRQVLLKMKNKTAGFNPVHLV